MAHTPGPWHCHFLGAIEELDDGGGLATGITTASIDAFNKEGDRGDLIAWVPHDRNEKANAHLIAAAPDLLAALKLLRDPEKLGRWVCYCNDPEFKGRECESCVATKAIDKAEGRTS